MVAREVTEKHNIVLILDEVQAHVQAKCLRLNMQVLNLMYV